jgi:hypothetical protein
MNIFYQWKDQLKISRYTTFDHIWPDTYSMNNKLSNIGKMTIKCTALGDVWPLKAQNSIHFIVIFAHWVNRSAPRCYFIILVFLLCNVRLFYSLWRTRFTRQGETSQMWSNFACLLILNCLLLDSPPHNWNYERIYLHLQGGVQVLHGVVHEGALLPTLRSAVCNATIPTLPLFEMAKFACSPFCYVFHCLLFIEFISAFYHVCVTGAQYSKFACQSAVHCITTSTCLYLTMIFS